MTNARRWMVLGSGLLLAMGCADPEVVVAGTITAFGAGNAVADAQVCVGASEDCVTTDASGAFELPGYPVETEEFIRITAAGHLPAALPIYATADTSVGALLLSEGIIAAFEGAIMDEFDPATSYVAAGAFNGGDGVAGAAFAFSPAGGGPIYLDSSGIPNPSLTETTAAGRVGVIDVPPGGAATITLTPPDGTTCARDVLAWPDADPLSTRVPLVAGHLSGSLNFICN